MSRKPLVGREAGNPSHASSADAVRHLSRRSFPPTSVLSGYLICSSEGRFPVTDSRVVKDAEELQAAVTNGVKLIEISGTIKGAPRVVLAPGVSLRGGRLEFGSKGVLLTQDNTVEDIEVVVPEHEIAIYADTTQTDWGALTLRGVTTVGQVAIIALDAVRSGHVIDGLTVQAADVRGRADRPRGFGVEALPPAQVGT
jgi:hypothetical protein